MLKGFICPRKWQSTGLNGVEPKFCLTQCSKTCMSRPLLRAIIGQNRESKPDIWHVTEILDPPQPVYLRRNRDYYASPYSFVWAIFGSAVHNILERHGDNSTDEMPTNYVVEKKFEVPILDVTLTGRIDLYDSGEKIIWDYKTIKEYSVKLMKQGVWDNKYKDQLNIYRAYGFPEADKLMLECIIKDWGVASEFKPVEDIEVPIIEVEKVKIMAEQLLQEHLDAQIGAYRNCTDAERWINNNPKSRNYKIPIRCRDFCPVSTICEQYNAA